MLRDLLIRLINTLNSHLISIFNTVLKETNMLAVERKNSWVFIPRFVDTSKVLREILPTLKWLHPVKIDHDLIRIGNHGDGGYLAPNDFEGIEVCLSIGSDREWSFEKNLQDAFGIRSVIIDSVDKRPSDLTDMQTFIEGWLAPDLDETSVTLEKLVKIVEQSQDLILKMDIEGAEYAALLDTTDAILQRFRIIVIEFHDFDSVLDPYFRKCLFIPTINRMLLEFDVVHFHPNNCSSFVRIGDIEFPKVFEVTFRRKSQLVEETSKVLAMIPHLLDRPNVKELPDRNVDWLQILN